MIPTRLLNTTRDSDRNRNRVVIIPSKEESLPTAKLYEIYRTIEYKGTKGSAGGRELLI